MAPVGQWRAQLPQLTPSVNTTQLSLTQTAWPIIVEDFWATVMGLMAPVGHTVEHSTHSGRHAPRSKLSSGCMRCIGSVEGRKTPLGHLATHSWQAVQCWAKCLALTAPGGTMGVERLAGFLSWITARPPSTFLAAWARATSAPTMAVPTRKARRVPSGATGSSAALTGCTAALGWP